MARNKFTKWLLILLILVCHRHSLAQNSNHEIERAILSARDGIILPMTQANFVFESKIDARNTVKNLRQYDRDESPNLRLLSFSYRALIGLGNSDPELRRMVIDDLIIGLKDSVTSISKFNANSLLRFGENELSTTNKNTLFSIVRSRPTREFIPLLGLINNKESQALANNLIKENIKKDSLSKVGRWFGKISWIARLALARMGDKAEISYCIQRIQDESDEVVRVSKLLESLAYIRSFECIEVLRIYLESNERLPSLNENIPGHRYSVYALDLLAQIVIDFPLKPKGVGYSDADIDMAVAWLRDNGNIRIKR